MKIYYTEQELLKLPQEKLIELVSFEYLGETYFYKDVKQITISEGTVSNPKEWQIEMKYGNPIKLLDKEDYQNFKSKVARYELLKIKINIEKIEDIVKEEFLRELVTNLTMPIEETSTIFKEKLKEIEKLYKKQIEEISKLKIEKFENLNKDIEKTVNKLNEITQELSDLAE